MVVAIHEELVRPGVMAVIEDLVEAGESGVLEIEGDPSGRIYLEDGHITFARASWVPGLAARLRAIAPSLDDGESSPSPETDDAIAAGLVLRHGYLTMAGLHEIIESIVVDAFLVLTIPLMADSPVAGIHFRPAVFAPTDLFPRLTLDLVRSEAIRGAELMAEYGLEPTTAVAPRDLASSATVLTREQWAVACQIGDRVSARELAMRRGASLSDTVHCLGSLVRAGLCAPVRVGGHRHAAPPAVPEQARRVPEQARRVPARPALEAAPPTVPQQAKRDGRVALPAVPVRAQRDGRVAPPAAPAKARRAPARAALEAAPPAAPPKARRAPARAALETAPAPPAASAAPAAPAKARRAPARAALEAAPPVVPPKARRAPARAALEAAPAAPADPPPARRVPARPQGTVSKHEPPSMDVLRQVLDGLRQLS